jgi:hypothetical protein
MKAICLSLLIAIAAASTPLRAGQPGNLSVFGTWTVDTSRLPMPVEARPRRVTITFARTVAGQLASRVEVLDASGATLVAEADTSLDGTPAPVRGSLEADVSATRMPIPQVLVMQLARAGIPASTRVYTVADDGESMIETVAYIGEGGSPVMRTNFFTRAR